MKREKQVAEEPQAVLREVGGGLVLDDPVVFGVMCAVAKHNCKNTFALNVDRVAHFKQRVADRRMTAEQVVIVLLNVDDAHGGTIADLLMPGFNWQEIRDRGEIPFARGLASRGGIQGVLAQFDTDAAKKLQSMTQVAVVVVDYGVAEVFPA